MFDILPSGIIENYSGPGGVVIVPEKINEIVVRVIGSNAFREVPKLKSVTLPEGLAVIGHFAFYGNPELVTVKISKTLTFVGAFAFAFCPKLKNIALPKSIMAVGKYAFLNTPHEEPPFPLESTASFGSSEAFFSWSGR